MLNTRQAAHVIGISQVTLRRYIRRGIIHPVRLPGGSYRITEDELDRFLAECQKTAGQRVRGGDVPKESVGVEATL